jgi:uncharacterized membrane protein
VVAAEAAAVVAVHKLQTRLQQHMARVVRLVAVAAVAVLIWLDGLQHLKLLYRELQAHLEQVVHKLPMVKQRFQRAMAAQEEQVLMVHIQQAAEAAAVQVYLLWVQAQQPLLVRVLQVA